MHLFCPSSSAWQSEGFVIFLSSQHKTKWTIKQTKNYAIRYGHILDTGDASLLLALPPRVRHHALVALANLAKYQGRYQQFMEMKQRYALKWTSGNESLDVMQHFFDPGLTLEVMIQKIHQMVDLLPPLMGKIVKLGLLVRLRPAELVECVRLINDKEAFAKYYGPVQMTLNHWKMPGMIRTTKKAYLSFVTPQMLEPVQGLKHVPSYSAIRLTCQRKGITCDLRYCRKVHATYLYQSGIPVEIVDVLQGRTPASIFAKHYYRPSLDYKEKVLDVLEELNEQIES
ncbi:MAG: hypothetical protein M3251_04875 [Thermoproteota archaeon]|nr:hypothetical protein [Thermoproteota archaeon]MDQ3888589.1 hypothetical protein [Thermoproteota archaeon]